MEKIHLDICLTTVLHLLLLHVDEAMKKSSKEGCSQGKTLDHIS